MSIPEMQACLAQLYVDDAFLRLFEVSGDTALGQYRLTEEERIAIKAIDRVRLRLFADSLRMKRKKRFEIAFPMLFTINSAALNRYYDRYYNLRRIGPDDIQFDLTMGFGKFLEEVLAGDEELPCYASDLARYERLYYAARFDPQASTQPTDLVEPGDLFPDDLLAGRPILRRGTQAGEFGYDVRALQEALERGDRPEIAAPGEIHLAFVPGHGPGNAKIFRLTPATHRLISLCDGRRTVSEIVDRLERLMGESGLKESIVAATRRLVNLGIVRFSRC